MKEDDFNALTRERMNGIAARVGELDRKTIEQITRLHSTRLILSLAVGALTGALGVSIGLQLGRR